MAEIVLLEPCFIPSQLSIAVFDIRGLLTTSNKFGIQSAQHIRSIDFDWKGSYPLLGINVCSKLHPTWQITRLPKIVFKSA